MPPVNEILERMGRIVQMHYAFAQGHIAPKLSKGKMQQKKNQDIQ